MSERRHVLRVRDLPDGEREAEIVHSALCPRTPGGPSGLVVGGYPVRFAASYDCAVGYYERDSLEMFLDVSGLKPGEYEVAAWHSHQPSTPNGPEEWDGGLEIVGPAGPDVLLSQLGDAFLAALWPVLAPVARILGVRLPGGPRGS